MTLTVTLLVLSAAVMHATWNAFVKAGNDKAVMQCLVIFFGGIPGLIILPFVPLPDPACWPYLVGSVLAHSVYYFTLVEAYRFGALSQTYPIARGSAPLLIAIASLVIANEHLNGGEWLGLIIACAGLISLAGIPKAGEGRSILFAFATSLGIACYSVLDGLGVRSTANGLSYITWLLALEMIPVGLAFLWLRRGRVVASITENLKRGLFGGIIAGIGYGIVIWAMDFAPMAHVSAMRETSVILAALIGTLVLHEPFGPRRIAAAALVAAGNALLHLAG
ncbi:MAG TPA: EamA family transporter [Verrucomicrobiae bacterium]|nr:EamA family transporter [Verrucomicrobiae bacterium]